MPLFYFDLQDGSAGVTDGDGTELPDATAARAHAHQVVLELMAHVEARTRHWLLDVHEEGRARLFSVPFVLCDRTIDHLEPRTRRLIEEACAKRRALATAIFDARANVRRACALVARSRGLPHLVADRGHLV
jgi:hypothetical protein